MALFLDHPHRHTTTTKGCGSGTSGLHWIGGAGALRPVGLRVHWRGNGTDSEYTGLGLGACWLAGSRSSGDGVGSTANVGQGKSTAFPGTTWPPAGLQATASGVGRGRLDGGRGPGKSAAFPGTSGPSVGLPATVSGVGGGRPNGGRGPMSWDSLVEPVTRIIWGPARLHVTSCGQSRLAPGGWSKDSVQGRQAPGGVGRVLQRCEARRLQASGA